MREAEIRLSQNLGSLEMEALAGRTPADSACMWLTLKARRPCPPYFFHL